jgi:hypothetical protein
MRLLCQFDGVSKHEEYLDSFCAHDSVVLLFTVAQEFVRH